MKKIKIKLSTTHKIMLSFLLTILIGSILLSLPIATKTGESVGYIDALFTATTSTCVTGLVTLTTVSTWNTFGQIVILLLIQIGGLGILTALFSISVLAHKKVGLSDGLLLQDALNINTMSELAPFLKKIVKWTLIIECLGAVAYGPVFIHDFGIKGLWISLFNAVSAFCNAGIDIIGENSLCDYVTHPWINFVTCALIISGGLGYVVWADMIYQVSNRRERKISVKNLSLHSKIALASTIVLIIGGAALILMFDYNNALTIGGLSFFEKIQASIFQSVTCRTAGFITIPQENFTNASALVSMILMFIGGSPVGTAGGVKTVTVVVLLTSALATIKNQSDVEMFNRRIDRKTINKSVAVVCVSLSIVMLSALLLSACTDVSMLAIMYETVSASATVGSTMALTPNLNIMGKIIIIITMYLGRVGPISLAVAFSVNKENKNVIRNPIEEINVG